MTPPIRLLTPARSYKPERPMRTIEQGVAAALLAGLRLDAPNLVCQSLPGEPELRFACVTRHGSLVVAEEFWRCYQPTPNGQAVEEVHLSALDFSAAGAAIVFVREVGEREARRALREAHALRDALRVRGRRAEVGR